MPQKDKFFLGHFVKEYNIHQYGKIFNPRCSQLKS